MQVVGRVAALVRQEIKWPDWSSLVIGLWITLVV